MANFRVSLAYIFGVVSLIISLGVANQGKGVGVEGSPSPTPSAAPLPKPEPFPGAARLARCQALSQPRIFFYSLPVTHNGEQYLLISGTVYASDLTPLPDAVVEIWSGQVNPVNHPYSPTLFGHGLRTNEAGHYGVISQRLTRSGQAIVTYRVTYQGYCPLLMLLRPVMEPPPKPAKHIYTQVQITGPVLQGPVDIVLPVPAPHR